MCIICDGTYNDKEELKIENCDIITSIPIINGLKKLEINNCSSLTELSNIKHLEKLKFYNCSSLTTIKNIEIIEFLEIIKCNSLVLIDNINIIEIFEIIRCKSIEIINNVDNIVYFNIIKCKSLKSININRFQISDTIYSLNITNCNSLKNINGIYNNLSIHKCNSLVEIPNNIYYQLTIIKCNSIKFIKNNMINELFIDQCHSLIEICDIKYLKYISINKCNNLLKITNLLISGSDSFEIKNCQSLLSVMNINNINEMNIVIENCNNLSCIPYINNKIIDVSIINCRNIKNYINNINIYYNNYMHIPLKIDHLFYYELYHKYDIILKHLSKVQNNCETICNICYCFDYGFNYDSDCYLKDNDSYIDFYNQLYKCKYCSFNIHINCLYKAFLKGSKKCIQCNKSYE